MICENYCSFEVSKLLKEKGFPQDTISTTCNTCYKYNGNFCNNVKSMSKVDREICFMAPTHQMVITWLKENHNVWIYCYPSNWKKYGEWEGGACWIDENVSVIFNNSSHSLYANEPEEVIEMILLYVLRNII